MENKTFAEMTIAEKFGAIASMVEDAEVKEFLMDRAAKATRKSGERKPSKTQEEMVNVICPLVLDTLAQLGKPVTVGELIKVDAIANFVTVEGKALTSSKVTSALGKLGDKVVNTKEKGKSFYAVA